MSDDGTIQLSSQYCKWLRFRLAQVATEVLRLKYKRKYSK